MLQQSNILLPTDFSHCALYALRYGIALARKYRGTVHIAHVVDTSFFSHKTDRGIVLQKADLDRVTAQVEDQATARLEHLCQIAADEGVKAHAYLRRGRPAYEIVALTQELKCGAVVIATHGRTGVDYMVFGSVAEKVVRHSPVPVLSVKHPEHEFIREDEAGLQFDLKRVLFPTDFSELCQRAMPYAASLCREFGAQLVLMHANEVPVSLPEFMPDTVAAVGADLESDAREALERIRGEVQGARTECDVRTGIAYREICDAVQRSHIDLVVMPTHGRSGVGHVLFGSVAEKVVRLARCPVLTVRPKGGAPLLPREEQAIPDAVSSADGP